MQKPHLHTYRDPQKKMNVSVYFPFYWRSSIFFTFSFKEKKNGVEAYSEQKYKTAKNQIFMNFYFFIYKKICIVNMRK